MITLRNVSKHFGNTPAIVNVSLTIPLGKRVVVIGGSGAGKTTLLRVLAGLEPPDAGSIFSGDTDITQTPPHKRGIAMLSQDYAIYPQLTIERNLQAALEPLSLSSTDRHERIASALKWFELTELRERRPAQLSGGQLQRAALAKAIVRRPQLLLLDEPLSQLDLSLREQGRALIQSMTDQFGTTLVMVTHDPFDALRMADVLAVMERGELVQVDSPQAVYSSPKSRYVAELLSPFGINEVVLSAERPTVGPAADRIAFRPEAAKVFPLGAGNLREGEAVLLGRIERLQYLGFATLAYVLLADSQSPLAVKVLAAHDGFSVGQRVEVRVANNDLLQIQ